jgi:hypothetical protein
MTARQLLFRDDARARIRCGVAEAVGEPPLPGF